jgi:hypothetical protein
MDSALPSDGRKATTYKPRIRKETEMKKAEKTRKALEEAVREARTTAEARRVELWNAEKTLSLTAGTVESGVGWIERRSARRAQETFETARTALDQANHELEAAEVALEGFMADQEQVEKADFKDWVVVAKAEAERLTGLLRKQQAEALATARALVALHVVGEKKAPRRVLSRTCKRFLRVELTDPSLRALYPNEDHPVLRIEVFRAQKGERAGRWKILPGQDCDPGEVEIMWGRVGLPDEITSIHDLNLGYLFRANGTGGKLKGEKLNAYNVEHFLIDEKDLQAAAALAAERT